MKQRRKNIKLATNIPEKLSTNRTFVLDYKI